MAPKTTKQRGAKPSTPRTLTFAEMGRAAAKAAQRKLLLKTLTAQGWNLTGTARALDMTSPSNVLRAIKTLELTAEYDAAKAAGKISPGSRTDTE